MTDTDSKYYVRRIDRAGTVHGENRYGAKKILGQVWKIETVWMNSRDNTTYPNQNKAARALQEN